MADSINTKLLTLLQRVGIPPSEVSCNYPLVAHVKFTFQSTWHFEVGVKDTTIRNPTGTENVVDEAALAEFENYNRQALSKDKKVKREFCSSLEGMSAQELFRLGNKINKLSIRRAKGRCTCPECRGSKQSSCPNCSGYGQILCPSCQGADGGCTRCHRTGYVTCPTCHSEGRVNCQKCRGMGVLIVERHVFLNATCMSLITTEYDKVDDLFVRPRTGVYSYCYDELLGALKYTLQESEENQEGNYVLGFKAEDDVQYLKFAISGENQVFEFYATKTNCAPLDLPRVLDKVYYNIKNKLSDAAVGKTICKIETKIDVFNMLCRNKFYMQILHGYEADFDAVTRMLKNKTTVEDTYTSKRFTMKQKLESILAVRKEELCNVLSRKLIASTGHLMSEVFARQSAMSLVEFISNLKFRPMRISRYWNIATLIMWAITLFLAFLSPSGGVMTSCVILTVIVSFVTSYYVTKNLRLFEVILRSGVFRNITKFIDFNYDIMRAMIIVFGVLVIEFVLNNIID